MTAATHPEKSKWWQWVTVVALVYLLICSVSLIGSGFKMASGDHAKELFAFATNPFAGLVVGTLATALIQSSSTVTSIIVGLVAGGLPVTIAVPMIMGANIGTSITNTIVSLGHVREKKEFQRAFSAATVHDFFNVLCVLIFLPLEMMFGLLEKLGAAMAGVFTLQDASMKELNFVKTATKPLVNFAKEQVAGMDNIVGGVMLIVAGILVIFLSISLIGKLLERLLVGRARLIMDWAIGRGPVTGIMSGSVVTVLVQSSSTTTSLMVPLAGSGSFGLKQIYPFTLGANIGTCVTALLAATAVTSYQAEALQIAFVHLAFNVLGVAVVYGLPFLRNLPVHSAERIGHVAAENKLVALFYILALFFVVPGVCLGVTALL